MITVAVEPGSIKVNTVRVCSADRNTVIVVLDCKTRRPQFGNHNVEGKTFTFELEAPSVEPMKDCCRRLQFKRPDATYRHNFCPECGLDLSENKFDPPAPDPATQVTLSNLPGTDWTPFWQIGQNFVRLILVQNEMFTSDWNDGQPEDWTAENGPVLGDWSYQTEDFADVDDYEYPAEGTSMVLIRQDKIVAHVEGGSGSYDRAHVFNAAMRCVYAAELDEDGMFDRLSRSYWRPFIEEDGYSPEDIHMTSARRWCEERLKEATGDRRP